MKVGRGTEEDVKVGPLIDATQREKVAELVQDATSKGAEVLVGGREREGAGYFFEPTVLGGVTDDARLLKEEIFVPRRGQRHRVRARLLRLHAQHQERVPGGREARDRGRSGCLRRRAARGLEPGAR
jgi:delta 1-pyrroline-5-carboxylate dehydrogenase